MNVIVFLTDSMRADHLGCHPLCMSHGGKKVQTPNMDKLASEGTLFENAYSGSIPTIPMRMDCWKGTYGDPFNSWRSYRDDEVCLAEALWCRGFTTALITDTYHMHKPASNLGRGFDQVRWIRGQEYDPWLLDQSIPVDIKKWHRLKHGKEKESDERWTMLFEQYMRNRSTWKGDGDCFTARVVKEAMAWLDDTVIKKGQKDNLFLWVDCFDPHEPWDPPEPYWSMYMDKSDDEVQPLIDPVIGAPEGYVTEEEIEKTFQLYAGEVTLVDKWFGDLLGHVESLGLYENTLIMQISDHGEPFNEHGILRKPGSGLHEQILHIPWIIRHPEGIGRGKRIQSFVQPIDMMPTIFDFFDISPEPATAPTVGFAAPPGFTNPALRLDGHSLLPLMSGEVDQVRDRAYSGGKPQWTIRTEDWAFLLPKNGNPVDGLTEGAESTIVKPTLTNSTT